MRTSAVRDVPMRVVDALRPDSSAETSEAGGVVLLEEVRGRRQLAIWVSPEEAADIAVALNRVVPPRPGPSQFAAALLAGADRRLKAVRISDVRGGLFYAQAVLDNGVVIDARPSDALTLAVELAVPVSVDEGVLGQLDASEADQRDTPAGWASYENASQIADAVRAFYAEQRMLRHEDLSD